MVAWPVVWPVGALWDEAQVSWPALGEEPEAKEEVVAADWVEKQARRTSGVTGYP